MMKHNKRIFLKAPRINDKLKSFFIAFSVFVTVLSVSSAILFTSSLEFNLNKLVENTSIKAYDDTFTFAEETYSVKNLSGNSNIMFVLLDSDDKIESVFCTIVDFDDQTFRVKQVNGDSHVTYNESNQSVNDIYEKDSIYGLKKMFHNQWSISVEKYAIFNYNDLKKFFSSFNGITVNVKEDVSCKTPEFNLELSKGKQDLSGEKALNYFISCESQNREQVICNIINSVLVSEYVDNAELLFKRFVNSSKTDISVIDFSQANDIIKIYCRAEDKFYATPFDNGDLK